MIRSRLASFAFAIALVGAGLGLPLAPARALDNTDLGALITNSLRIASTTANTSVAQTNTGYRGVVCTWVASNSSGSTSTVFGIQQFDAASSTWQTIKSSAALVASSTIEAANTPHSVAVYPGVAVSSLATGMEAQSAVLPKVWRITQTISAGAGTNPSPAVTGKIGCNYVN